MLTQRPLYLDIYPIKESRGNKKKLLFNFLPISRLEVWFEIVHGRSLVNENEYTLSHATMN